MPRHPCDGEAASLIRAEVPRHHEQYRPLRVGHGVDTVRLAVANDVVTVDRAQ